MPILLPSREDLTNERILVDACGKVVPRTLIEIKKQADVPLDALMNLKDLIAETLHMLRVNVPDLLRERMEHRLRIDDWPTTYRERLGVLVSDVALPPSRVFRTVKDLTLQLLPPKEPIEPTLWLPH